MLIADFSKTPLCNFTFKERMKTNKEELNGSETVVAGSTESSSSKQGQAEAQWHKIAFFT